MNSADRRTTYAEVDPRLMPLLDRRDEALRLAYFDQSRRTVAGKLAPFRSTITLTHEIGAAHVRANAVSDRDSECRGAIPQGF